MENITENTERKELATIGDVLEGFLEENANQIFWDRIKNLVIDNARGISEITDGLNASERIVWHLEEKIEVILYEDESVEILKDTKHYDFFHTAEKAYNELVDVFGAVDGEEAVEQEMMFGHVIENRDGERVVTVSIDDIEDENFVCFYKTVKAENEKINVYIGENYYEARWYFEGYTLNLTYYHKVDPEEYYAYVVSKTVDDEEKLVAEFDDIEEALTIIKNWEKKSKKAHATESTSQEKNEFGHRIGTIADRIDQLLKIGCTVKEAEEAGIKAMRFHVHFSTMKRENTSVKCWKEGNKYFAEAL